MLKAQCQCEDCGYTVRVARQWVVEVGAPVCPDHMEPMAVDMPDEDPGEGEDLKEAA